jgi:hypothetical protein
MTGLDQPRRVLTYYRVLVLLKAMSIIILFMLFSVIYYRFVFSVCHGQYSGPTEARAPLLREQATSMVCFSLLFSSDKISCS